MTMTEIDKRRTEKYLYMRVLYYTMLQKIRSILARLTQEQLKDIKIALIIIMIMIILGYIYIIVTQLMR